MRSQRFRLLPLTLLAILAGILLGQEIHLQLKAQTVPMGTFRAYAYVNSQRVESDSNGVIRVPRGSSVTLEWNIGYGNFQQITDCIVFTQNSVMVQEPSDGALVASSTTPRDDWKTTMETKTYASPLCDSQFSTIYRQLKPSYGVQELPNQTVGQTYYLAGVNGDMKRVSVVVYDQNAASYPNIGRAPMGTFRAYGPSGEVSDSNGVIRIPSGSSVTLEWNIGYGNFGQEIDCIVFTQNSVMVSEPSDGALVASSTVQRNDWKTNVETKTYASPLCDSQFSTIYRQLKPSYGVQELPNQTVGQTYYLAGVNGDTKSVTVAMARCGDGEIASSLGEQCDDGNTTNNDGCSTTCRIEPEWVCSSEQMRIDFAPPFANATAQRGQVFDVVSKTINTKLNDRIFLSGNEPNGAHRTDDAVTIAGPKGTSLIEYHQSCTGVISKPSMDITHLIRSPSDGAISAQVTGTFQDVCGMGMSHGRYYIDIVRCDLCGNGFLNGPENCDDGNLLPNDGCSPYCTVDAGWTCNGAPSICQKCGNGTREGTETCDDGNETGNDGCSATCQREASSSSSSSAPPPSSPSSSSQSSSSSSLHTSSFSSLSSSSSSSSLHSSSSSSLAACGNGSVEAGEQCDDRNATNGDGCTVACQREAGWMCAGSPSVCQPLCGDGIRVGTEQCDDGNLMDGDGCSPSCFVQTVTASSASASSLSSSISSSSLSAQPLCGNGKLEIGEQCERGAGCTTGLLCDDARCLCVLSLASSSRTSIRSSSGILPLLSGSSAISADTVLCGNGKLEAGEQCERGIPCASGFCSTSCLCASLSSSSVSRTSTASLSSMAVAMASSSATPLCGNGVLNVGEQCDEGLPCPLDSFCTQMCICSAVQQESATNTSAASTISAVCGDGLVEETTEQCDDGNLLPFDGCSFACKTEHGYSCFGEPSACLPVCGDGIRIPPEQCDDANPFDDDGCSSVCELEYAAAPEEIPSAADSSASFSDASLCGNGLIEANEECDDGNLFDGDSCDHLCVVEVAVLSSSESSASSASFVSLTSSSSSFAPMPTTESAGTGFWWWVLIVLMMLALLTIPAWVLHRRGKQEYN